ncbi:hypothetical protein T4B_9169 [Trichinella pseudospiralis]|uniref:Uncharacterized protein n=1 Tax=Trichinella pseudospiralis TaxID=6337 RepID=A0A0V1GMP1_TRIPS|nr:hypothetical protein T4B_9169 [Trichinella pseudospiralis]
MSCILMNNENIVHIERKFDKMEGCFVYLIETCIIMQHPSSFQHVA